MELSKEHFDKAIKGLATKDDLKGLASKTDIEELARMVSSGFEDLRKRMDVRDRVIKLEGDMKKIKDALHIR